MTGQRGWQADGPAGRRGDAAEGSSAAPKQQADLVEWRSRGQLEPMAPSTAPGYWSDDDDGGPKPADLYGKFTWKIENFSEISKRELRSNVFEVGGYKWYILVYPQGCDVCNHLSLFLCVADYDKLLPGWSHFAQFTIAVVNKDPKKSKYSDTLHRFCKKEHDWGWKKFMELSKVLDGFTVADTLVIKAQVQVIRENPGRPFRCLDCQYRRELVRVYLTNVEGICRRFVEEKREKLSKVMDDSIRWASFRVFWSAVEENARKRLAREKADVILKAVVKRFFNEKEVTSTLVMDALHSGCKALDKSLHRSSLVNRSSGSRAAALAFDDDALSPIVWIEKDTFVLGGDVLAVLERAVNEPIPVYKDDKGGVTPNRTKEGSAGDEFGKDSVEGDERRLAELGRRTVEMFVLSYLFSNRVEVAYREAVALKRQEELIREEEEAEHAETERKKEKELAEKEKKAKKRQAKQRKKDRKAEERKVKEEEEDRLRREKASVNFKDRSAAIITIVGDLDEEDDEEYDDEEEEDFDGDDDEPAGVSGFGSGKAGAGTDDEWPARGHWEPPAVGSRGADASKDERKGFGEAGVLSNDRSSAGSGKGESQSKIRKQKTKGKKSTQVDDSSSTASSDSGLSGSRSSSLQAVGAGGHAHKERQQAASRRAIAALDVELVAAAKEAVEAVEARALAAESEGVGAQEAACSSGHGDGDEAETQEAVIASLRERVSWLELRLEEKEEEVQVLQQQLQMLVPSTAPSEAREPQTSAPSGSTHIDRGTAAGTSAPEASKPGPSGARSGASTVTMAPKNTNRLGNGPVVSSISASGRGQAKGGSEGSNKGPAATRTRSADTKAGEEFSASGGVSHPAAAGAALSRPGSAPITAPVPHVRAPPVQLSSATGLPATPALARSLSTSAAVARANHTDLSAPSNSAAGLLPPGAPPVVPSYRNAAAGRMRVGQGSATTTAGSGQPAMSSASGQQPSSTGLPSGLKLAQVSAPPAGGPSMSQPTSPSPPVTPPPRARTTSPAVGPSTPLVTKVEVVQPGGQQASDAVAGPSSSQPMVRSADAPSSGPAPQQQAGVSGQEGPPQNVSNAGRGGITFGTVTGDVLPRTGREENAAGRGQHLAHRSPHTPGLRSMLHPGMHPAMPHMDSPGLSEDFPHLSLINDLLDDGDFLGGFDGHPGMPHPALLRKLHPNAFAHVVRPDGQGPPHRGLLNGGPGSNGGMAQQPATGMPAPQGMRKDVPPGPGDYGPNHGMRRQEPPPQLRHTRSLPHGVTDGILSNGHGPPPPHYWVPAGAGYTQGMHNGPIMEKLGNGGPAYMMTHPHAHPGFMPYAGPPPPQQQQQQQ